MKKAPVLMLAGALLGLVFCIFAGVYDLIEGSTVGFVICLFDTLVVAFALGWVLMDGDWRRT